MPEFTSEEVSSGVKGEGRLKRVLERERLPYYMKEDIDSRWREWKGHLGRLVGR